MSEQPRTVEMNWTVENQFTHTFTWDEWVEFIANALGFDGDPEDLDACYDALATPNYRATSELHEIADSDRWFDSGDAKVTDLEIVEPKREV